MSAWSLLWFGIGVAEVTLSALKWSLDQNATLLWLIKVADYPMASITAMEGMHGQPGDRTVSII